MKLTTFYALFLFEYISSVLADHDIDRPLIKSLLDKEQVEKEWLELSENNTKRVFNLGIGSLTSYGSRQYTESGKDFSKIELITPTYPAQAIGIRRSFNDCWRYAPMTAHICKGDDCPPVEGAVFEVLEDSWAELRDRESSYSIVEVSIVLPLPEQLPLDAKYFAWGENYEFNGDECYDGKYPPQISQAYWDFIIGGILAWDGQLLDTKRYTWDLDAELASLDKVIDIRSNVHVYPTVGDLEERRQIAIRFVQSTEYSSYPWVDDRKCPFTGNANIILGKDLEYPEAVFGPGNLPTAFGSVSPITSQTFYDYVDDILIEGGWEFGARNSIHERQNPCPGSDEFIDRTKPNEWEPNPYYEDIVQWNKEHSNIGCRSLRCAGDDSHSESSSNDN